MCISRKDFAMLRHIQQALLLAILLLGLFSLAGGVASAQVHTPLKGKGGTWSLTGSMNVARVGHTATLLPNGKVLVVGGSSAFLAGGILGMLKNLKTHPAVALTSAELYDPSTAMWSLTGSTHYGRFGHIATLLSNGKVLVTGGYSKTGNTAELYNPKSGKWTRTGSMQVPRDVATATLLPSGKVLVAGGFDFDTQRYLASAE